MELSVEHLQRFLRRLAADHAWPAPGPVALDLELLRALHREITGDQASVRRAGRDGQWTLEPATPGKLRTRPQTFRIGDHIEPAWDHAAVKPGVTRLLREATPRFAADPVAEAAHLLWALSRAQPFVGGNLRVALALVSHGLQRVQLPGLPAAELERDPELAAALIAATADDRARLERWLATAIWDQALALVESLAPPPLPERTRGTLRDDHLAAEAARRRAPTIDAATVEALADRAAALLPAEAGERQWITGHDERLRVACDSASRGRLLCPHLPILVAGRVVVGSTGRGISGAMSMHLAVDHAGGPAPGLLMIPDEPEAAGRDGLTTWIRTAAARRLSGGATRI